MTDHQNETPTEIQIQVGRLQEMVDAVVSIFQDSKEASELATTTIPNIESLRAKAKSELDENGSISTETYSALSTAMVAGEDVAWELDRKFADSTKLVCRQFDNVHIMMNKYGLKKWPPGSTC